MLNGYVNINRNFVQYFHVNLILVKEQNILNVSFCQRTNGINLLLVMCVLAMLNMLQNRIDKYLVRVDYR